MGHPNNRTRLFAFHFHYIFSEAHGSIIRDAAFTLFPVETLSIRQDISNPLISHHNSTIWHVLSPVNGLFVIQYSTDSVIANFVALWNPSTTEFRELLPPFSLPPDLHYSDNKFGFGSTEDDDDIKLVWINQFSAGPEDGLQFPSVRGAYVALYSLALDSWRPIEHNALVPCIAHGLFDVSSFTYLNGAYYWWVIINENPTIVFFDMGSEVFREVQLLPPLLLDNNIFKEESSFFVKQLLLHDESIACVVNVCSGHGTIVESVTIWKMKEEGS